MPQFSDVFSSPQNVYRSSDIPIKKKKMSHACPKKKRRKIFRFLRGRKIVKFLDLKKKREVITRSQNVEIILITPPSNFSNTRRILRDYQAAGPCSCSPTSMTSSTSRVGSTTMLTRRGFLRRLRTANARHLAGGTLSGCRGRPPASSLPAFYCHDGDEQPLVCSVDKINNDELRQMQLADPQSALFHCLRRRQRLTPRRQTSPTTHLRESGLCYGQ